MPADDHEGPSIADNWVRLTAVAPMIGVSEQRAREIHKEMGSPCQRIAPTRGKPIEVNTPDWFRCWKWYMRYHDLLEKVRRQQGARCNQLTPR